MTRLGPWTLRATELSFAFPSAKGAPLFADLSFEIGPGQVCSIVGPSGVGKSTLLRILAGQLPPSHGSVSFGIDRSDRVSVLYHPQEPMLLPWLTVRDNALLGLQFSQMRPSMPKGDLLVRLGLGHLMDRYPARLSGGQIERAALARTLLTPASNYLLDEPLAGTDYALRVEIEEFLIRFIAEQGVSIILVTHDLPQAAAISDFIIALAPQREAAHATVINAVVPFQVRSPLARRGSPALGPFVQDLLALVGPVR